MPNKGRYIELILRPVIFQALSLKERAERKPRSFLKTVCHHYFGFLESFLLMENVESSV